MVKPNEDRGPLLHPQSRPAAVGAKGESTQQTELLVPEQKRRWHSTLYDMMTMTVTTMMMMTMTMMMMTMMMMTMTMMMMMMTMMTMVMVVMMMIYIYI